MRSNFDFIHSLNKRTRYLFSFCKWWDWQRRMRPRKITENLRGFKNLIGALALTPTRRVVIASCRQPRHEILENSFGVQKQRPNQRQCWGLKRKIFILSNMCVIFSEWKCLPWYANGGCGHNLRSSLVINKYFVIRKYVQIHWSMLLIYVNKVNFELHFWSTNHLSSQILTSKPL